MRYKYLIIVVLLLLSFSFKNSLAQGISIDKLQSVKVSQLSDEQITQAWKKLQESGMSEQDAYKLLLQKGMSPIEVAALQDRVTLLGLSKSTPKKLVSTASEKKVNSGRDTGNVVIKPSVAKIADPVQKKLSVFGTDFFNQNAVKFETNFSMATPKSYVLGPGDEVIILVTGLNETTVRTKVSPEGNLQVPYAGITYVNGFTIEQATKLIKKKLTKVYPALTSGATQLAVNLGNTRSIKITLVGEVKVPGTYTVSSLSTLFNVLHSSGGPTENGSLRYIELIRNNKVYRTADFYNFLINGVLDGNIRLEDQDVVHIPVYKKRVSIDGQVKRPAIYELKGNETVADLIKYAGGYSDIAYTGVAKVDQINALQREVKDVPSNLFDNYILRNGDAVQIGAITERYTNRVVLEGSVYRPGVYELTSGLALSQLLKNAQGLKPEAYIARGYIKRTLPNLEKEIISFVPNDVLAGKKDVPLMREDSVMIMDQSIFVKDQNVVIEGFVKQPTIIAYRKGLTLADMVAMAGGFANEAAKQHITISRTIDDRTDTVANNLVQTFTIDLGSMSANGQEVALQPLDYIYVPRLVNYRSLGNISVKGEVIFPGDYAVEKRNETAMDLLKRAGGLTPYASLQNIQIFRNGTRVNADLEITSRGDTIASRKMILLPGDSIYVPRVISYVEVAGAVNNPQYITYNGRRFKYYIHAAAGTTQNARLKGAYIKYADGLSMPVRHFLFFRNYPTVKPGSKIIVPEKTPDSRFKIGIGDIGGIATALTALVSIIAILSK